MTHIEKLIEEQLNYYNMHDLDGFLSTYSPSIKIYNLEDHSLILEGTDALKERYKERFSHLKVHADIVNRMIIGNKVIDHEHVSNALSEEITKAIAIYEVKNELISTVWFLYEE